MFYSISRPYDSFSGGEWGMGVRGGEGGFATIPGKYWHLSPFWESSGLCTANENGQPSELLLKDSRVFPMSSLVVDCLVAQVWKKQLLFLAYRDNSRRICRSPGKVQPEGERGLCYRHKTKTDQKTPGIYWKHVRLGSCLDWAQDQSGLHRLHQTHLSTANRFGPPLPARYTGGYIGMGCQKRVQTPSAETARGGGTDSWPANV